MPADFAVTELWRVSRAVFRPYRQRRSDRIRSVGFAVEWTIRRCVTRWRWLKPLALGQTLPLIADQDDPKNLFALLAADTTHAKACRTYAYEPAMTRRSEYFSRPAMWNRVSLRAIALTTLRRSVSTRCSHEIASYLARLW